ncbi:SLC13 family permease [Corynebacterium sp. c25Ua_47]|uniref:SLC13 family permease n=1 Tax=Corynebacterium sp. c25Ua_47 TaxID=3032353 RepID=UPI0032667B40
MGSLPVESKKLQYTLDWSDAAKIDWDTIILFGCGMTFGAILGSSGLAETIGSGLDNMLGVSSALVITAMAVLLAILISETTSNTAAAAVTVPIVVPLAMAAGVDPVIPAMATTCRFGVVGTASPRSWYRCSVYPVLQGVFFHS